MTSHDAPDDKCLGTRHDTSYDTFWTCFCAWVACSNTDTGSATCTLPVTHLMTPLDSSYDTFWANFCAWMACSNTDMGSATHVTLHDAPYERHTS